MALAMVFTLLAPMNVSANVDAKPFKQDGTSESTMQLKAAIAEQLNLLEGGSTLHKDLQGLSGNEEVAVIVHLSEKPVALEQGIQELAGKTFTRADAAKAETKVQAQHTFFKKEINAKKIALKEGYSYNTVLNGFSATVRADDLKKLLDIKGVTLIEPDAEVHAFEDPLASADGQVDAAMNTSISFLGIEKLWAEGIEGQGIKVAVLDTGIDKDHPDFAGIYKGGKNFIPHSSNYTKPRAADDASETSPVERVAGVPEFSPTGSAFYTSHGTHVAGTIAAIGANPYGVKGIAPKVDLYAYRVLGAYGSGSTSGIIAAIETAVIEKMDVINLSLGGGANSETDGGSFAINNAMMAGTISVIATGNSGPNRGTMGTPATARLGIAVGNTTNPEAHFDSKVNVAVGDYQLSKTINLMGTTFGQDAATQLSGEYEVVAVPGLGKITDYNGIDVNGKVALVARGEIAFVDKIAFAKGEGAIAVLIHNSTSGSNTPNASGTFLGDAFEFIPTYDLSLTDGEAIRAALKNGRGTVKFADFNKTMTIGDDVNDSSSRGPSTPNFDIKPDVSAPGTNIMSTIPMYKSDFPDASYEEAFTRKTGTSMATPHIAGIAALVKQANPDWNAFDVKVALSNTAKILDTKKYDVMAQGAGRVQAYAAARPNVLAYAIDEAVLDGSGEVVENIKGTVTFGPQSLKENNISVTKEILVKDIKGNGGNYDVTVDVTKAFADAKVTVDKSSFILNGEQLLTVTLTASKNTNTKAGSEILGYIKVKGEGTEVSLPFAADFAGASATAIQDMAISETDLSFNNDGYRHTAELTFKLTGDVMTNYIELWDIMNPDGGEYGDGYIGYLHAGDYLPAGSYKLDIDGMYRPWTPGKPLTTIPDGLYTIDFSALTASGNPPVIGDYAGPIVVKSTAGTIEGTVAGTKATGKIIDKYVDYQAELENYDLGFDLNTKLKTTFEVLENEVVKSSGPVKLAQDGTFIFDVGTLDNETDSLKVKYVDAAGNAAELVISGEVVEEVVEYSVDKESLSLEIGGTEKLTVTETTTKEGGTTEEKDVTAESTFTSADPNVATVENGTVTAVGVGSTEVLVSYNEFTATIAVEVTKVTDPDPVSTLSVSPNNISLHVGDSKQLAVTSTDEDGVETDVTAGATYSSFDDEVVTVSKEGNVVAVGEGATTITVLYEGKEATVEVAVTEDGEEPNPDPVSTLSVSPDNVSLKVGDSKQLAVTLTDEDGVKTDVTAKATYSGFDGEVITVSEEGNVVAIGVGTTTITVTNEGKTATVSVAVTEEGEEPNPVSTLSISPNNFSLIVGDFKQLAVTSTDEDGVEADVTAEATYSGFDEGVVSVSAAGNVAAVGEGNAVITVSYEDLTATVSVKVERKLVVNPPTPPTGGGSSTPSPSPSTPTSTSPVDPGKVVVDDKKVADQVNDSKTSKVEVTVPAPTEAKPDVKAEVSATAFKAIVNSSKPLVVNAGAIEVSVPSEVLKAISQSTSGKVIFNVGLAKDAKVPGNGTTLSNVYEFSIQVEKDGKTSNVTTFSKPVSVSIPVDAKAVKDSRKVAAYYVNEVKNTLEYVDGKYANGKVEFKTNHFSKFVVVENNKTFKDIQSGGIKWVKDYVEVLASKSIVQGKSEDTFAPSDQITRAQFAQLLSRALDLPKQQYEGTFSDVTEKMDGAVLEIEAANRAGIVTGNNGKFQPNDLVTRQQMAAMIIRAIEYKDASILEGVNGKVIFADAGSIADYAKEYVGLAAELGIIGGKEVNGENVFAPKENATRAHAAKMLYYLLETL